MLLNMLHLHQFVGIIIFIKHINRRCKIFRIARDVYRGKYKYYSLTWTLAAALVNLRYGCI